MFGFITFTVISVIFWMLMPDPGDIFMKILIGNPADRDKPTSGDQE